MGGGGTVQPSSSPRPDWQRHVRHWRSAWQGELLAGEPQLQGSEEAKKAREGKEGFREEAEPLSTELSY